MIRMVEGVLEHKISSSHHLHKTKAAFPSSSHSNSSVTNLTSVVDLHLKI